MKLKIRKRTFKIEDATLGATLFRPEWAKADCTILPDKLTWGLTLECSEKEFGGESWEPTFEFERMPLKAKSWHELEGLETTVKQGKCFVVGHGSVGRTALKFGKRRGATFDIQGQGVCDVDWDDEYGRKVPFEFQARVTFSGIRVCGGSRDTDASLAEYLASRFKLDDLRARRATVIPVGKKQLLDGNFIPISK
jgi:hypothetical protein